ncbi:hypothetical protein ASG33_23540 [Dyadobacter sp. Leaf189]|nr:hypothetical protein ASG33_23540 [Dyadobacter sp. Leaf189]
MAGRNKNRFDFILAPQRIADLLSFVDHPGMLAPVFGRILVGSRELLFGTSHGSGACQNPKMRRNSHSLLVYNPISIKHNHVWLHGNLLVNLQ